MTPKTITFASNVTTATIESHRDTKIFALNAQGTFSVRVVRCVLIYITALNVWMIVSPSWTITAWKIAKRKRTAWNGKSRISMVRGSVKYLRVVNRKCAVSVKTTTNVRRCSQAWSTSAILLIIKFHLMARYAGNVYLMRTVRHFSQI
jgi:hypothetical protein